MSRIVEFLKENMDAIVGDLEEFVSRESPSDDKALLDGFARFLASRGEQLGGHSNIVASQSQGNHVRISWEGKQPHRPIVLLGHFDTVWPAGTIKKMPFCVDGDVARGPGIFDMKGGIVQGLWAVQALKSTAEIEHPIVLLCNSDEEIGSPSSRDLIEQEARNASTVLVLEPSLDGRLKTARKGVSRYRIDVTGQAAHAGLDPFGGVSAIDELCRIVLELHRHSDANSGTTVNAGVIHGGTRFNVVAEAAWTEVDVRAIRSAELERVSTRIQGLRAHHPTAHLEVQGGVIWPPMERTEKTVRLFELARALAGEIGFTLEEGTAGGASDGSLCAAVGAPVLDGLGAVGGGAHAADEHLDLASLPLRAGLIARLIQVLPNDENTSVSNVRASSGTSEQIASDTQRRSLGGAPQ